MLDKLFNIVLDIFQKTQRD